MPLKVADVIYTSATTEFRSDVQLMHYRSEENYSLVKGYIFTKNASGEKRSSIDLLKYVCESFTPGSNPNRFVFIATYGHGKSHFGLALANFFGKNSQSKESKKVLERVSHAVNDDAVSGYFTSFKETKKPYLVVILSGIEQRDLPTQFFHALEIALADDKVVDPIELPFWYRGAEKFLQGIVGANKEKANKILEELGFDIDTLIERVRIQDSSTYDICQNLCSQLYGISANFGSVINLKDAVEWVSDNVCGEGKSYSGLLILFDEFSAFVRDYGISMNSRPGTPLQDLLDGVDNRKGKVCFIAFSQHDPDTVARNLYQNSGNQSLQNLLIQLSRLPFQQRYQLHSCLEEVLDSYIKQDRTGWAETCNNSVFASALFQANDAALECFSKRYIQDLAWNNERFQEVVTKGCYPLHPMTTAILSSVELQETASPRSVLGFVLRAIKDVAEDDVLKGDFPAWIFPVVLVDYFKEMLGAENWNDYLDAASQAGGVDAVETEIQVLKGMLLQKVAHIPTRRVGYEKVIGQLVGQDSSQSRKALQNLASRGVIRHDEAQNLYMFWPAGRGASKVEELIAKKISSQTISIDDILTRTASTLHDINALTAHDVSVPWGHREDWQVEELMLSQARFTSQTLEKIVAEKIVLKLDDTDKYRGLIIWCIPGNNDEVQWFSENVKTILASTFGGEPVPVVIKTPRNAQSELVKYLRRLQILLSFSSAEIQDVGKDQYDSIYSQNLTHLKESIDSLRIGADAEIPPAFRARINAVSPRTTELYLLEIMSMAYANGPKKWFTQYKSSQTSLKGAVKIILAYLFRNALDSAVAIETNKVAKEAVINFLKGEWSLLGADLRITPPRQGGKVASGWDVLDGAFPAKANHNSIRPLINKLLNVPYGYDPLTVSLLLGAWLGYNKQELEIIYKGDVIGVEQLQPEPKDFLKQLDDVKIKRRDPDELKGKVQKIISRLDRSSFDLVSAKESIKVLSTYIDDDHSDNISEAKEALNKLNEAMEKAIKYDAAIDHIYSAINRTGGVKELFSSVSALKKISFSSRVAPKNPPLNEIRADLLKRLQKEVEQVVGRHQKLSDLSSYQLNRSQLVAIKNQVEKEDLTTLKPVVDQALQALDEAKKELEGVTKDREMQAYLRGLPERGSIKDLRRLFDEVNGLHLFTEAGKAAAEMKTTKIANEIDRILAEAISLTKGAAIAGSLKEVKDVQSRALQIFPLFEGVAEAEAISAVVESCKAKELEFLQQQSKVRTAEEHDAPLIEAVQSVVVESLTLSGIEDAIDRFERMNFETAMGQQQRVAKIKEMARHKSCLLEFLSTDSGVLGRLTTTDSISEIKKIKSEILISIGRYDHDIEKEIITSALKRCEQIEICYSNLMSIKAVRLDTPVVLNEAISKLESIEADFASSLTAPFMKMISDVKQKYLEIKANEIAKSIQWLAKQENELSSGANPGNIIRELDNCPPFLPDSEQPRLAALSSSAQSRIDEDQVLQVEVMFRRINSVEKQLECISRLQNCLTQG